MKKGTTTQKNGRFQQPQKVQIKVVGSGYYSYHPISVKLKNLLEHQKALILSEKKQKNNY